MVALILVYAVVTGLKPCAVPIQSHKFKKHPPRRGKKTKTLNGKLSYLNIWAVIYLFIV